MEEIAWKPTQGNPFDAKLAALRAQGIQVDIFGEPVVDAPATSGDTGRAVAITPQIRAEDEARRRAAEARPAFRLSPWVEPAHEVAYVLPAGRTAGKRKSTKFKDVMQSIDHEASKLERDFDELVSQQPAASSQQPAASSQQPAASEASAEPGPESSEKDEPAPELTEDQVLDEMWSSLSTADKWALLEALMEG